MSSKIQLRRGTAAQWTNQVLDSGEIGYETDTGNLKIGDNSTQWASLSYYMSPLLTSSLTDLSNAEYERMGRFDLAAPATTYTNGPSLLTAAEGASKLIVTKTANGCIQQIISQNYFFTRAKIGGSWQAWKQLPTSDTANTVNTLVRRDASGNFAAGTITAALTGNASTATNAATATALATARTIAITGDVAYSQSFDGTANITGAGTLATVNTNVGSFGSTTVIPIVTVNAKGLTTAVSTATVVADANTLSGTNLKSTVTTSSLTTFGTMVLGTPTSGTLTNCISSSTPSLSTNLATKGFAENLSRVGATAIIDVIGDGSYTWGDETFVAAGGTTPNIKCTAGRTWKAAMWGHGISQGFSTYSYRVITINGTAQTVTFGAGANYIDQFVAVRLT